METYIILMRLYQLNSRGLSVADLVYHLLKHEL